MRQIKTGQGLEEHNIISQTESSLRTRITKLLSVVLSFQLVVLGATFAGDAKAQKTIVRARDGLSIVCESRGTGETALLFLHGLCGDREYWKHQVDAFAADYRVVTVDQAGHGESGKRRQHWKLNGLAEDVESLVKGLGLNRIIIVGHSMSGPIGLMAAKRMPDKVIGVIGVDTLQNAEAARMPEDRRQQFLGSLETNFTETVRGMYSTVLPETADPDLKKWLANKAERQHPKVVLGLMHDLLALEAKTLLKEAKAPVRCINSAGGYQLFEPTAIEINGKYADYNAVLIEAVGHYPMLEKPAEFNRKLRQVLNEFTAGRQ